MILFGKETTGPLSPELLEFIFTEGAQKKIILSETPLARIIETLDAFGRHWRETPALMEEAMGLLGDDLPFHPSMVRATLAIIPEILSKDALEKRVRAEFGEERILDKFFPTKNNLGLVRAFPLGEVLHVTAGNVFISCVDSLVMGLLTKNVTYLKLSSRNNSFPFHFARALLAFDRQRVVADKFCVLLWKGGDASIENRFKRHVPAILAWGGEEMLASYREGLAPGTKLLDYGPKISFQLLTRKGLEKIGLQETASGIARDLVMWDQQACSSPQNLFVEEGVNLPQLMGQIGDSLDAPLFPRGELGADEQVEILKERERARVSRHLEQGHSLQGKDWLLHHETRPFLRASPLNRTLIIKTFKNCEDFLAQVAPFRFYLQTCGYLTGALEKEAWLSALGAAGIKRFAPLGHMADSFPGLPHDGRYGLTELVNFTTDETGVDEDGFLARLKKNVPYYRELSVERLEDMPLTDGSIYAAHDPVVDPALLDETVQDGRYFASGGSTGKPKHVLYSNADFDRLCAMLADHFLRAGVRPGMKVANLFAAGTLYSSFLAVDKYCEKMGLRQLPIGGLASPSEVVKLLAYHRPEAVFGLPGLLIQFAQETATRKLELSIPMVFFAGENLSDGQKAILKKIWGTHIFRSAGYASVDAGLIGWQCAQADHGVHHLSSPHVRMEIVEGEAVVTSFARTAMPVVRYRTGDRVNWIEGTCGCGDTSPRFKLLGRMDGQINIWACRIQLDAIEKALGHSDFQVKIENIGAEEHMTVRVARETSSDFARALYASCEDLQKTLPEKYVAERVTVTVGALERNPRTGKTTKLVDAR